MKVVLLTCLLAAACLVQVDAKPRLQQLFGALGQNTSWPGPFAESMAFTSDDTLFVSFSFSGQIYRIPRPYTSFELWDQLPIVPQQAPCGAFAVSLGLAVDSYDNLYVAVTSCPDQGGYPSQSGIYNVSTTTAFSHSLLINSPDLSAQVPVPVVWNGIAISPDDQYIYMADTFGARVWRSRLSAGASASIWSQDEVLRSPVEGVNFPGPNGLRYRQGLIYVSVSKAGNQIIIPILGNGEAGPATLFHHFRTASPAILIGPPFGPDPPIPADQVGCDEFDFDSDGSMYCTTDPFDRLIRISPNGRHQTTLYKFTDGLDGPTSALFGRHGPNRRCLYITNSALPFFPAPGVPQHPLPRNPGLLRACFNSNNEEGTENYDN